VTATLAPTARRDLYALVARLLGEELDAPLYHRLLSMQSDTLRWIEPELAELPSDRALEALDTEYCRLFLGPPPVCSPYASVLRGEAVLGGRARTRVDDFLAASGLAVDARARIASSDHVAVAFATLAELSAEEAITTWLRDFVAPWVPQWLCVLETSAERQLYRVVAHIGNALIAEDRARYLRDSEAFRFEVQPQ
jgi:TorA maturation chaperone TorD